MTESRQIEFLARAIVNRLEDRALVEFDDAEEGIRLVTRAIEGNFAEYDAIEHEAQLRLTRTLARPASPEELGQEMQKVAAERGIDL